MKQIIAHPHGMLFTVSGAFKAGCPDGVLICTNLDAVKVLQEKQPRLWIGGEPLLLFCRCSRFSKGVQLCFIGKPNGGINHFFSPLGFSRGISAGIYRQNRFRMRSEIFKAVPSSKQDLKSCSNLSKNLKKESNEQASNS